MPDSFIAVVLRDSNEEDTVALVEAAITDTVHNPNELLQQLRLAITDWMQNTLEGREALVCAGSTFNIECLSSVFGDTLLTKHLNAYGVKIQEITCVTAEVTSWDYDTDLFIAEKLKDLLY